MAHSPTPDAAEVETGSSLRLIAVSLAYPAIFSPGSRKRWITPEDPHTRISDLE